MIRKLQVTFVQDIKNQLKENTELLLCNQVKTNHNSESCIFNIDIDNTYFHYSLPANF